MKAVSWAAAPSRGGRGDSRFVYFVGVIDILSRYDAKSRAAQAYKQVKHGPGAEISTVRPDAYAKRFLDFVAKCAK